MNAGDYVLLGLIFAGAVCALIFLLRNRRKGGGCGGCGGCSGCSRCAGAESCSQKEKQQHGRRLPR